MTNPPAPLTFSQSILATTINATAEFDTVRVESQAPQVAGVGIVKSTNYSHTDHLGSGSLVTDSTGALIEQLNYQPFGKDNVSVHTPAANGTMFATKKKFTGKEVDDDTGLYYYGARYYNPAIARFISVDPVSRDVGSEKPFFNPQLWNTYSYVANNPIKYIDPDGRDRLDIAKGYCVGLFKGGWNSVKGTVNMILNPIDTAENIATLIRHPILAAQAFEEVMGDKYDEFMGASDYRAGEMFGELVGEVASAAAAAKLIQKISRLAKVAKMTERISSILKPAGQWIGEAGSSNSIRILKGGLNDAEKLFDELRQGGTLMKDTNYPGAMYEMPDGTRVGLRAKSTMGSQPPTVDIHDGPEMPARVEVKFINK